MRTAGGLLLLLFLSCRSADDKTKVRADAAPPTPAPSASQAEPPPLRRIERIDEELPPVADRWKSPARAETGRCWSRLQRLDWTVLEAIGQEFAARNPGWQAKVEPFTGHVWHAEDNRAEAAIGSGVEASEQVLGFRALSLLRRNADLLGLSARELDALPVSTSSSLSPAENRVFMRYIPCDERAMKLVHREKTCWEVDMSFARDGLVRHVSVRRQEPKVDLCTTPRITAEQARAMARAHTKPGNEVGAPWLMVKQLFKDGEPEARARSVTWLLAWRVGLHKGYDGFYVDAVTGEDLGVRREIWH